MKKFSFIPAGQKEFNKHVAACAELIRPELKLCTLQVNVGTGAWRSVMDFEVEDSDEVMDLAEKLFEWGYTASTKGIRLRIMKPGDTAPLMNWSENEGWKEWRGAA